MIRAMLLAVYACALPSASAFVASPRPFSARGVPQSKRIPEVACALKLDPDQLRDLKSLDNTMYSLYDIVFKDSLPPNVTLDNVTQHFTSCATEFNETRNLNKLDNKTATNAIAAAVKIATGMKDKLILEEVSVAELQILAGEAQIAAAAFSWAPGLNLGLEAGALVLFATATGLAYDAASYQESVINYISKLNNVVVNQSGMDSVRKWQQAVSANGAFYSLLNIGVTQNAHRAIMLSIPTGIQQHKLGSNDADGYKAYIKKVGGFVYDNQGILDQYERLLASINNSTTPQEIKDAKKVIAEQILPGVNITVFSENVDIFMDFATFAATLKDAGKWYKTRRTVANAADDPPLPVDDVGDVNPALEGEAAEVAEESWVKKAGGALGEGITVLGAVASVVLGYLALIEATELDVQLTSAIDDVNTNLTTYYNNVITNAPKLNDSKTDSSKTDSSSFKDAGKWYKTRRTVANAADNPPRPVDEVGDVNPALEGEAGEAAEESWIKKACGALGKGISVLWKYCTW